MLQKLVIYVCKFCCFSICPRQAKRIPGDDYDQDDPAGEGGVGGEAWRGGEGAGGGRGKADRGEGGGGGRPWAGGAEQ